MNISADNRAVRFIGKPADKCRKCHGSEHWVNRMFGICCLMCDPPGDTERDALLFLDVRDGVWHNDEWQAPQAPLETPASSPDDQRVMNEACDRFGIWLGRQYLIERAMHAFADDHEAWGWFDPSTWFDFLPLGLAWNRERGCGEGKERGVGKS